MLPACRTAGDEFAIPTFDLTKSAEKPRRSRRGWIGVGRDGLNAQEPNNTHAVPEPSMGGSDIHVMLHSRFRATVDPKPQS